MKRLIFLFVLVSLMSSCVKEFPLPKKLEVPTKKDPPPLPAGY
jgi:hypothetical protein